MAKYKFRYKRKFGWKVKEVIGHRFDEKLNRMDLFLLDGSIYSIGNWSDYDMLLDKTWVEATKVNMEKEAKTNIVLNTSKD